MLIADGIFANNRYNVISNNVGTVYSAGTVGSTDILNSQLIGNSGSILYTQADIISVTVSNSTIGDCSYSAFYSGGSVGRVVLTNRSVVLGSVVESVEKAGGGGFLSVMGNVSSVIITNGSSVVAHRALGNNGMGGAIFVGGRLEELELSRNSTLSSNSARNGGGAVAAGGVGLLRVCDGAVVSNNSVGDDGVFGNYKVLGDYVPARGGAVYVRGALDVLEVSRGARLEHNHANADGGAVFAGLLRRLDVRSALLYNNTAVYGGGGAIASNGTSIGVSARQPAPDTPT